jgi:hypothetical protein
MNHHLLVTKVNSPEKITYFLHRNYDEIIKWCITLELMKALTTERGVILCDDRATRNGERPHYTHHISLACHLPLATTIPPTTQTPRHNPQPLPT